MTWTAALLPDDALDLDSLVGRMLKPNATSWQEWPGGECPRCGYQDLEIRNTAEHGWATDGDQIRCRRCGLVGWMDVDAEDACDEMFPDDYEELPDDWESPPSPDTAEPLPLWRVMEHAGMHEPGTPRDAIAAEIEALRDWLLPEDPAVISDSAPDDPIWARFNERQRLRSLLTKQARIARGKHD